MSASDPNESSHSDYDEKVSVVSEHAAAAAREKPDPKDGNEPVSLWGFFIAGIALIVGAGYLGATNGGFSNNSFTYVEDYTPKSVPDGGTVVEEEPFPKWVKEGKKQYSAICAACHQTNGTGQAGIYPPLANSEWVYEGSERLAMIILNGIQGPITVDGKNYNSLMTPWKDALNDKQMAQLMTYIRTAWGNDKLLAEGDNGIVTEEMVKKARTAHNIPGLKVSDLQDFNKNIEGPKIDPATMGPMAAE